MSIESSPRPDPLEKYKRLIRSPEEHDAHPFFETGASTFTIEAEHNEKLLVFIGSNHTNKPESPVFSDIRKEFDRTKPDKVFIEGSWRINSEPEKTRQLLMAMPVEKAIEQGEPMYTLWLAVHAEIEFESPEPDPKTEIPLLEKQGFSRQEILSYYIFRTMAQYLRRFDTPSLEDARTYIRPYLDKSKHDSGWNPDEFEMLSEELLKQLSLTEDYNAKADPMSHAGRDFLKSNEVARTLNKYRDEYILERVAASLKTHNRLFAVYGSGHAILLEPALYALVNES